MTRPATTSRASYVADGLATPRNVGFPLESAADLAVKVDGVLQTLNLHYSITGPLSNPVMTPLSPFWANGAAVRYKRKTPAKQEYDAQAGVALQAESLEATLDRNVMAIQDIDGEQADLTARAVRVREGESLLELPQQSVRANKYAAFDSQGNIVGVPGSIPNVPALASNIIADGGDTVQQELDARAPISTKSTGAPLLYPVEHRLGRDAVPHIFEYVPAAQHNAIIAFTSTYECSSEFNAMFDEWKPDNGKAGTIPLPVGRFALGQTIFPSNWVSLRGEGRGTQLFLLPDHADAIAFQFDSDPGKLLADPSSYFEQRLECLDINCNDAAAVQKVIYAPSWNEKCGLRDVLGRNIPATFLDIDEWHGGSAGFHLSDVELMFSASAYSAGKSGIALRGLTRAAALIINKPQIKLQNVTMAGATAGVDDANPGLTFIEADNVHLQLGGVIHFEKGKNGIIVANGANVTGLGLTGSTVANRVVNLLARASTHTGRVAIDNIELGDGDVRALQDNKTGNHVTNPVGGRLSFPALPGEAYADGFFAVEAAAIDASPAPVLRGCGPVTREATGYYKVILADAVSSGSDYYVRVETADDTACYGVVRASERSGSQFFIRVYRETDDSLFDPTEVTFTIHRRPGV